MYNLRSLFLLGIRLTRQSNIRAYSLVVVYIFIPAELADHFLHAKIFRIPELAPPPSFRHLQLTCTEISGTLSVYGLFASDRVNSPMVNCLTLKTSRPY